MALVAAVCARYSYFPAPPLSVLEAGRASVCIVCEGGSASLVESLGGGISAKVTVSIDLAISLGDATV